MPHAVQDEVIRAGADQGEAGQLSRRHPRRQALQPLQHLLPPAGRLCRLALLPLHLLLLLLLLLR